eukprot:gene20697-27501_t
MGKHAINPADAQRKLERKKEISRNKMERKFVREAQSKRENPLDIRKQLEEIIEAEDAAPLNKALRLRKKVLQEAYDAALKRKKDDGIKNKIGDAPDDDIKNKIGDAPPPNPWVPPFEAPEPLIPKQDDGIKKKIGDAPDDDIKNKIDDDIKQKIEDAPDEDIKNKIGDAPVKPPNPLPLEMPL